MSVLLDTGVLYAHLDASDSRHREARDVLSAVHRGEHGTPVVSDLVYAELLTLLRVRFRDRRIERAAIELLDPADPGLPGLLWVPTLPELLDETLGHFTRGSSKRLSFTDASLVAILKEHGLDALATFDKGLRGLVPCIP